MSTLWPRPVEQLTRSASAGAAGRLARRARLLRSRLDGRVDLEVVCLEVTAACDSGCVTCDYRRAAPDELTLDAWLQVARDAVAMGAEEILVTGGEPLVRPDLGALLRGLHALGAKVSLHTNGLRLAPRVDDVAPYVDHLLVSVDGWDAASYHHIRGVDGWDRLRRGVRAIRAAAPDLPVTARSLVTASSVGNLARQVAAAVELGVTEVSFLAVDIEATDAFARHAVAEPTMLPTADQVDPLRRELAAIKGRFPSVIADSDAALVRIGDLYADRVRGLAGAAPRCRAPWTVAVVGSEGALRPCFFLPAHGSARDGLAAAVDAPGLRALRRDLRQQDRAACRRCVCWR